MNKRTTIPKALKIAIWNKHIGEEYGKVKCLCCKITDITQSKFHCGHIVSVHNGGETNINNLKPICESCNKSMGTDNMNDFIALLSGHNSVSKTDKQQPNLTNDAISKIPNTFKIEYFKRIKTELYDYCVSIFTPKKRFCPLVSFNDADYKLAIKICTEFLTNAGNDCFKHAKCGQYVMVDLYSKTKHNATLHPPFRIKQHLDCLINDDLFIQWWISECSDVEYTAEYATMLNEPDFIMPKPIKKSVPIKQETPTIKKSVPIKKKIAINKIHETITNLQNEYRDDMAKIGQTIKFGKRDENGDIYFPYDDNNIKPTKKPIAKKPTVRQIRPSKTKTCTTDSKIVSDLILKQEEDAYLNKLLEYALSSNELFCSMYGITEQQLEALLGIGKNGGISDMQQYLIDVSGVPASFNYLPPHMNSYLHGLEKLTLYLKHNIIILT